MAIQEEAPTRPRRFLEIPVRVWQPLRRWGPHLSDVREEHNHRLFTARTVLYNVLWWRCALADMFTLGGALWPHWLSALRRRTYPSLSEETWMKLLSHCFHHRRAPPEEQAPMDTEASLGVLTLAAQRGLHTMRRTECTLFNATHRRALAVWPFLDP